MNFVKSRWDHGLHIELWVAGIRQDAGVFQDLHRKYGDEANFLTDDEFTFRAGELIEFSDVVVGIGRSAMEAVMMRKSTFVSGSDASLPIFLDRHLFDLCAKHNFSMRTPAVGGCDPEASFERFVATLQSAQEAQRHAEFLDQAAGDHFDAAVGARLTLDYYAKCRTEPAWALQKFEAWQARKRRNLRRRLARVFPGFQRG